MLNLFMDKVFWRVQIIVVMVGPISCLLEIGLKLSRIKIGILNFDSKCLQVSDDIGMAETGNSIRIGHGANGSSKGETYPPCNWKKHHSTEDSCKLVSHSTAGSSDNRDN